MSWAPGPPRPPAPWFQRFIGALHAPGALREDGSGVGVSLTEAMVMVAGELRGIKEELRRANDLNQRDDDP